jgi:hypothetical protein
MPVARTAPGAQANGLTSSPAPLPTRAAPTVAKQGNPLAPAPNALPVRGVPAATAATATKNPSALPTARPGRSSGGAIAPDTIANDQPAAITITGSNFAPGVQVLVGTQTLTDVRVSSLTALAATVPAGICPGTYPVTVRDSQDQGRIVGSLVVQGVQKAIVGAAVTGPTFKINGRAHWELVPQASVQVTDTTCGRADAAIVFAIRAYVESAKGQVPLAVRTLQLSWPGADPVSVSLSPDGDYGTATVHIPRTGIQGVTTLTPAVEMEIPASALAGRYVIALNVTLAPHT